MKRFRSLNGCIGAFYLNAIVQSLLNYFLGIDLIDVLFVTHLLLAGGTGLMSVLMLREYRACRNREILAVLRGLRYAGRQRPAGPAAVLGAGDPLLRLHFRMRHPGVCIVCLLGSLITTMAANLRHGQVLVYKRLSREDRLTGLENRRQAFDAFLAPAGDGGRSLPGRGAGLSGSGRTQAHQRPLRPRERATS
ncbi:MAG: hypothetical protein ACLU9S_00290 [Oscillospiraceae bacterium]